MLLLSFLASIYHHTFLYNYSANDIQRSRGWTIHPISFTVYMNKTWLLSGPWTRKNVILMFALIFSVFSACIGFNTLNLFWKIIRSFTSLYCFCWAYYSNFRLTPLFFQSGLLQGDDLLPALKVGNSLFGTDSHLTLKWFFRLIIVDITC